MSNLENAEFTLKFEKIDGIFTKFKNTRCSIMIGDKQKFTFKSIELNKIDHRGYYVVINKNDKSFDIICIGNNKKYNDFAYKISIDFSKKNRNEANSDKSKKIFKINSLNNNTKFQGYGSIEIDYNKEKSKKTRKCFCDYCPTCLINAVDYKKPNNTSCQIDI